jgi:hypothetical protein
MRPTNPTVFTYEDKLPTALTWLCTTGTRQSLSPSHSVVTVSHDRHDYNMKTARI